MRLLTSKRLKENEAFMWRLADQLLDEFVADGQLRVHQRLLAALRHARRRRPARRARGGPPALPRGLRAEPAPRASSAAAPRTDGPQPAGLARRVVRPATSRTAGASPAQDVLTDLALATYPDGTMPDVTSVVRTATFLFAAGQETTARLLAVGAEVPRRAPRAPGRAAGAPAN